MKPKDNLCTNCKKRPYQKKSGANRKIFLCDDCYNEKMRKIWREYNRKYYGERRGKTSKAELKSQEEIKKVLADKTPDIHDIMRSHYPKTEKLLRKLLESDMRWQ